MHAAQVGIVDEDAVARGQPLFEVYSPELVSVQREYLIAYKGSQSLNSLAEQRSEAKDGMRKLALASLQRLKAWDISDEQIEALEKGREPQRTLSYRAPAAGIVMTRKAVQGMRFMPGETLFELADLSSVWVIADVFEQDLSQVKTGAAAEVRINAYPGEKFAGRVTYVYPTLKAETRTVPVRVELPNPGGKLKPGMFAEVMQNDAFAARFRATFGAAELAYARAAVDRFFTEVFVMADDPRLRNARLKLMADLRDLILQFADISEIVPKTE